MLHSEVLSKFLEYNRRNPIEVSAFALYVVLLEKWKDNNFQEFSISIEELIRELSISRKTIVKTKDILLTHGLIKVSNEKGLKTVFNIVENYELPTIAEEKNNIRKEEFQSFVPSIKKEPIKEDIDTSLKTIEDIEIPKINVEPPVVEIPEIPKSNTPVKTLSDIPKFDEILEFAKTLPVYDEKFNYHLESKYLSWKENGWKNGLGDPIINWKGLVRNTIPHLKGMKIGNEISVASIPSIKAPVMTYNE